MCRNITILRGLQPEATSEEIEAAALQFVRKIGGITKPTAATQPAIDRAVEAITRAATALLEELPERRQPPPYDPPLRRRAAAAAAAAGAPSSSLAAAPRR